ncbi:phosphoribosylformylglycinamidine cyclo-ligase [Halobacteriales archaeon QH_10_67_13]|nr:MAG: phosphoribosylformylglycinamidine cyclo-ligase [Halobacteriales archaeon QH_10_67_13]
MDDEENDQEGLTYSEAGVDLAASDAAVAALVGATGEFEGEFAGLIELDDRYLGLTTDGVGTKLLVAAAVDDYSTVGIDCLAMNANDLVAEGLDPIAFVDYLAVEAPDEATATAIGEGLRRGAREAGVALTGGETAVLPEIVSGLDLAGACVGLAPTDGLLPGTAQPGDRLVGWASGGIHSNGLTLAREAVTREFEYEDPFPPDPDRTVGEALLEPTRLYTDLVAPLRGHEVRAAAHVTGGGWRNLTRMGAHHYEVTDPFPAQPVFELVRSTGDVADREMHRTFNMGTGFVAAVAPEDAPALAEETDGRVIGRVTEGEGVAIRGLELGSD